jgi:hypothetical protein
MVSIILTSLSCSLLISFAVARRICLMSGSPFEVYKPRIGAIDLPNQDKGASPETAEEMTLAAASDVPIPIASGISGNALLFL